MNRYFLFVVLMVFVTRLSFAEDMATDQAKPNILFIMSDDHATNGIGAYGGRFADLDPTPTLDRLASEGTLFTNCFCTNAICSPSRACIITGKYNHINGVKTLNGNVEPADQTLPLLMKKAGYETAIIGKWHLSNEPAAFDFYTVLPGQGAYFNPKFLTRGKKPYPQNEFQTGGYDAKHSSDAITDLSLRWLKNRKSSKPFFLMHHFKAPHDNFENAERYDWLYEGMDMPEPESLWVRGNHGPRNHSQYGTSVGKRNDRRNMGHHMEVNPSLNAEDYKRVTYQRYMKKFLRCVRGVDDNIKRLLDHLESTGELENTIVIYTADQGFMLGEHDYIDKRWMYEESQRMPLIVRYPKRFQAGQRVDSMINNVDFAPTLLQLAGIDAPADMQGRSFASMLEGEPEPEDWPDSTYYRYWMHMKHHDNPAHYGIRTKTAKLIYFYGQPLDAKGALPTPTEPYWELYDLAKDPLEMNNVVDDPSYADLLTELKQKLQKKQLEVRDLPWNPSAN